MLQDAGTVRELRPYVPLPVLEHGPAGVRYLAASSLGQVRKLHVSEILPIDLLERGPGRQVSDAALAVRRMGWL